MGVKISNNARTFLTSGLSNSATTVVVDDTVAFPDVSAADDYFYATLYNSNGDVEIVKVNNTDANSMTVERAQQNTDAAGWDVNDNIELRLTAGTLTEFIQQLPPNLDIATGKVPFNKLFTAEDPDANSAYLGYDPMGVNPDGNAEGVMKWFGYAAMARGMEAVAGADKLDYETGLRNKPDGASLDPDTLPDGSILKRHLGNGIVDFSKVQNGTLGYRKMNLRDRVPDEYSVIGYTGSENGDQWEWKANVPIRDDSIPYNKLQIAGEPTEGQGPLYNATEGRFDWGSSGVGYGFVSLTKVIPDATIATSGIYRLVLEDARFLTHSHFRVSGKRAGSSSSSSFVEPTDPSSFALARIADYQDFSRYFSVRPTTATTITRRYNFEGFKHDMVIVKESETAEIGKLYMRVSGTYDMFINYVEFFNFA